MPYSGKEYETMNVNYLNKDFSSLKSSLIEYAKTYFPNTYRDFNETSPGMMLIEMSAYVGDVMSFYIDQQYKEMLLPLAEERRNLTNMATMFGYKVKAITPAYVDMTITQTVGATTDNIDDIQPLWTEAMVIDKKLKITSATNSDIIFETLDVTDFTISGSVDNFISVNNTDVNGIVTEYKLTKNVKAISGETKTTAIVVGSPEKFKRITLPETNIIEIIDVYDSSNNRWYEVEYLTQNRVPDTVHWSDDDRILYGGDGTNMGLSAYADIGGSTALGIAIPYTLDYINVSKRFIIETNDDNTTSLVFGNGLLNTGLSGSLIQGFLQSEQAGITIPGDETNFDTQIAPHVASFGHASLGEIPQNTTLTITYRVGGGLQSNVASGDLTLLNSGYIDILGRNTVTPIVTNEQPARGGQSGESLEEIRQNTQGNFMSQRRCVTKEDYEARVLSMPAKFGNIAKITVNRHIQFIPPDIVTANSNLINNLAMIEYQQGILETAWNNWTMDDSDDNFNIIINAAAGMTVTLNNQVPAAQANSSTIYTAVQGLQGAGGATTIDISMLSYDNNKNLVYSPTLLHTNLNNYLKEYRMITDEYNINNGYIINFGVVFEVVAHKHANNHDVKLRCINRIIEYFDIDKMKMHQPIYTNDIIYELMGIDGVRAVNYLELTQQKLSDGTEFWAQEAALYDWTNLNPHPEHGGTEDTAINTGNYGYQYSFNQFYNGELSTDGVILPSTEASVFELKNPNENIKGSVI